MKGLLVALALLGACADDPEPLTWGNLALQLGTSYCGAAAGCGFTVPGECAEHVQWHLCEPNQSCGVVLPEEAQIAMDICDDTFRNLGPELCVPLLYGLVPPECEPVFGFDPGPQ